MYKANKDLVSYADVFDIPREIYLPFVRMFQKYLECNGEEFTVKLFKELKLSFVKRKAHPDRFFPVPWQKHDGCFHRGPMGALERWCRISHKRWSKVIKLLGIFTSIYAREVLPSQEKKFLDGVNSKPIEIPDTIHRLTSKGIQQVIARFPLEKHTFLRPPKALWEYSVSPTRRAPFPDGKSYPENENVWNTLAYTRFTSFGMGIRQRFRGIFDPLEHGISVDFPDDTPDVCLFRNSVGKIGFIQEPGMKLRAVANPGRIYQSALRPLGDALFGVLKELPWDCTFDQSKGVPSIQDHLRKNMVCHSIDLTGATDYFPLDLQKLILDVLFKKDTLGYTNLFYLLSRGEWMYSENKTIRWTKGQPLGLYPSFAAFALTHGILLYALNDFQHNNQFFVLGDDVVILSDELHKKYINLMVLLECPISGSKSISSSCLAEFAGMLISQDDVQNQHKWRVVSDDSFLDTMRNIGPKALRLLRPRQKRVAKLLWEVPDFMGGLGFNPKGKKLEQRVYDSLVLLGDRGIRSYLLELNRFVTTQNYTSGHGRVSYTNEIFDPDKGFKEIVQSILPTLYLWYEIAGGNLWLIEPSLRLRFKGGGDRLVLLEQLENKLL
jgi:hypothetical protein